MTGVVCDLQATQSVDQRHRGIPRYVADLASAIEEIAPQAIETYFINPDLAVPEAGVTERLLDAGKLCLSDDVDWGRASLLHIASPLEMTRPGHRLLPPAARAARLPWVVTFYDLIPQLMPEYYLEDPGLRRRYRARLQLVRNAAGVLTLSEATRADVIEHLALDPERVFVIGAGTSSRFVPPTSREGAAAAAMAAVPGLRAPYVFYIGSYERRKNLEPLLEAWALLPEAVRKRWQLALCCPLKPLERNHLLHRAAGLGVVDSVCLTGFVTDDTLLLLHQGTELFVFPSIYEGYGLPVAEALACGAPVLASNSSSLPEILDAEALFDATSPEPMAAAIERGLTDSHLRERLFAAAGRAPSLWTDVAAATVDAYEEVLDRLREEHRWSGPPPVGRSRRVGFVGPVGSGGGPVGQWNQTFMERLAQHDDLDVRVFNERTAGLEAPYDDVVYSLANDDHHTATLAALRNRKNGTVVAHDAYLSDLYAQAARTGDLPGGLEDTVTTAYGDAVLLAVGRGNRLDTAEARRLGVLLARDAIRSSQRFLATSEDVAALARLDAHPADRNKVGRIAGDPAPAADAVRAALLGDNDAVRHRSARTSGPVFFDLQALQTVDQRHRGIARYVLDLALALEETAPDAIGAYLVNPDLALPEAAERFVATGKVRASDDVDWNAARILHIGSLFEMGTHLDRLLPPAALAAGAAWTVTFHDLIPWLMPESYLEDPGRRRRYRARLQLLRTADAVLTNSEATRADAIEHLGLDAGRVLVAGTGTGRQFVPPRSRSEAATAAAAAVPGLHPPFVFYVGSYDRRKNLEPFLEAWSRLDPALRSRYTLVVSAIPDDLERNHLFHRAAQFGITDGLCVAGFLPDDVLLLLLQGTDLFVFPSLYEGYGLPVAEALACGAPVLAADTSSLPEIVSPEALFDPTDPDRMAAAITRGLTDEPFRNRLLTNAGRAPSTWGDVAGATTRAWERILRGDLQAIRRPRRTPRTLRLAVAAALPPDGGPRAAWNRQLLEELSRRSDIEVHAFVDRPATAGRELGKPDIPDGVSVHPLGSLEAVERCDGPFDGAVYVVADDEHHCGTLAALRRRRDGVVVTHDAYLSDLYGHAECSGALHEGIGRVVRNSYGDLVASGFDADRPLPAEEARRLGILFSRDAVAQSARFIASSARIGDLVRLDATTGDRPKITVADGAAAVADAIYRFFGEASSSVSA